MSEWWSYRPADFLMFSPSTYWRQFELLNQAWWPAQPLLVLAGLAWTIALATAPRGGSAARAGAAGLAVAWAFVAIEFLLRRYAPINWVASGFAVGFAVQAAILAAYATSGASCATSSSPARAPDSVRRCVGAALCAWAAVGHPLLAPAFGRPWMQAEVIGLAPDPTAIATLGLLVATGARDGPVRWLLRAAWVPAVAWCTISSATLGTMGSLQAGVPLAAMLAAWAAVAAARTPPRGTPGPPTP
jgi:hypothetical protein